MNHISLTEFYFSFNSLDYKAFSDASILILCYFFAELPWLLLPGLCCMGTAGLTVLATNLQVCIIFVENTVDLMLAKK